MATSGSKARKTWFDTVEEMQAVLDAYLVAYNTKRPHQGRGVNWSARLSRLRRRRRGGLLMRRRPVAPALPDGTCPCGSGLEATLAYDTKLRLLGWLCPRCEAAKIGSAEPTESPTLRALARLPRSRRGR